MAESREHPASVPFPARETKAERVVEHTILAVALWTLYGHAIVLAGGSFQTLVLWSWMPAVAALFASLLLRRWAAPPPSPADFSGHVGRTSAWMRLAGAALVIAVYAYTGNTLFLWAAGTVFALLCQIDGAPAGAAPPPIVLPPSGSGARWPLIGLALLAAATTLVVHRPDADDAFYLSLAVGALDFPEQPLLQSDSMFGEVDLPLLNPIYRTNTYELLVAVSSQLTSVELEVLYYLFFPALIAALWVPVSWAMIHAMGGARPTLAVGAAFVVLLTLGESHSTHANFGFVRLFQGKAILVTLIVPAIVYSAARFVSRGDAASWVLLFLSQVAALGVSPNGLYVGPAAAALVLCGSLTPERSAWTRAATGLLASIYVGLFALASVFGFEGIEEALSLEVPSHSVAEILGGVLGTGVRAPLLLLALLALPALHASSRLGAGWAVAITATLLSPVTPWLLSFTLDLDWRIFWAVPVPLVAGLALSGVASLGPTIGRVPIGVALSVLAILLFAASPAPWTISETNRAVLQWPTSKVDPAHEIARQAVAATPPGGAVLAPWEVSAWIPTLRGHPRVIEVREFYLPIVIRGHGIENAARRRRLQRLVAPLQRERIPIPRQRGDRFNSFAKDLEHFGITTVVIDRRVPWKPNLTRPLRQAGFRGRRLGDYQLWSRPRSPAVATDPSTSPRPIARPDL